ncbi:MAG: SWIM zinc finger family protein, partial [Kofleriaceae bacterium]|nr:SWIM zinc finger family protein [Kofleriaceae bacterium]
YVTRIWVREEGLAYECTCPMGEKRQFCKHAVAIALAHLEKERATIERDFALLQQAMMTVTQESLVVGLLRLAKQDPDLATELKRVCLDALQNQQPPPS